MSQHDPGNILNILNTRANLSRLDLFEVWSCQFTASVNSLKTHRQLCFHLGSSASSLELCQLIGGPGTAH